MLFKNVSADIKTVSISATGRAMFYDANDRLVLGVNSTEEVQVDYTDGAVYLFQKGAGTSTYTDVALTPQSSPQQINGTLYKLTFLALDDLAGRPYTALNTVGYDLTDYITKLASVYEDLNELVFEGCCGGGGESDVLFYTDEASFPTTGTIDKLYVDKATPAIFIWDGAAYVAVGGSGGAYIPLAGTVSGSPVTGKIEYADPATVSTLIEQVETVDRVLSITNSGYDADGFTILNVDNDAGTASALNLHPLWFSLTTGAGGFAFNSSGCFVSPIVAGGLLYDTDHSATFLLNSIIDLRTMKSRIWTKAGTPTTTDDSTQGYVVGSLIWDTTNDIFYKCTDNTATAAVWTTAISGGTTIYKSTTDSAAVTGTTTVTKLRSQLIPANTFAVGDIIRIRWRDRKTGTAGNATHSLYVNTSDTVTGASLLGFFTQTSTRVSFQGKRDLVIKSSTVTEVADNGTSLVTDDADIQTAFDNINIDWTVDQYLIFAVNPSNAGDSMINSSYIIEPKQ